MKLKFNWGNLFLSLLWILCLFAILFVFLYIYKEKKTLRYSLGENNGSLTITKEISWYQDNEIKLDRAVTYWDAIRMVDSLNKTITR